MSRSIDINNWKEILFEFDEPADSSGYEFQLTFQNGCQVSTTQVGPSRPGWDIQELNNLSERVDDRTYTASFGAKTPSFKKIGI